MTNNTEKNTEDLLDKIDTVECLLAEISVAIANAAAACDELEEAIPLALKSSTNMSANMLSALIASMCCSCAKAEDTCTELQFAISEPIF